MSEQKTCYNCDKIGDVAKDQTWPATNEIALDAAGVVSANEWICGECLDALEDFHEEMI